MAITLVQRVGLNAVGAGSPIVTVPAGGCALGNHLIAVYATNGATALTTPGVSDSKGNTWQNDRIHDDGVGAIHVSVSSAKITTALVSGDTITVTPTGGGAQRTLAVYEYSGLDATTWRDAVNSANATSTTPASGNLVTAADHELMIGACAYNLAVGYAPGATGGNTPVEDDDNAIGTSAGKSVEVMHILDVGLIGTYTANGTILSAAWVQAGVTYKAAVTASGPFAQPRPLIFLVTKLMPKWLPGPRSQPDPIADPGGRVVVTKEALRRSTRW